MFKDDYLCFGTIDLEARPFFKHFKTEKEFSDIFSIEVLIIPFVLYINFQVIGIQAI